MLRILIVGTGSIGERHLRCFQRAIDGQVAFVEPIEERRRDVAARYEIGESFASLDDAARQTWDAAVICTPAHLHVDHVVKLRDACGAFLIEKPLATRLEDVPRLREALGNKPVETAYCYRVHPAVEAIQARIAAGDIGEPLQLVASSGQNFPSFRPAYREIYYKDRRTGGGAIQDALTHMANLAHHFVGRFDWVFCDYAHQALEGVEVEDTAHLTARASKGKVLATIALNQFMAPNESRMTVNGTKGSLRMEIPEHRWGIFRYGDTAWKWSESLLEERDDWFGLQARRFVDVVQGRKQAICPLDEAEHTLAINLAALESAGEKRVKL
jgi:predicted dehydrogenase